MTRLSIVVLVTPEVKNLVRCLRTLLPAHGAEFPAKLELPDLASCSVEAVVRAEVSTHHQPGRGERQ